ncbi:hypothetical protein TN98_21025 [Pantoea anthophila]|nr:hypothetical protein TN98_21025 [Pantoea anthophila]
MDDRLNKFGWLSFENWPDSEVHDYLTTKCGIIHARKLPDGSWINVLRLIRTFAIRSQWTSFILSSIFN